MGNAALIRRSSRNRLGVALVAALLLVLQTVGGAFTASAAAIPLDAYGNPLCITSGEHAARPASEAPAEHGKASTCCTLACGSAAAGVLPPPDAPALAAPLAPAPLNVAAAGQVPQRHVPERAPANPRAPPPRR